MMVDCQEVERRTVFEVVQFPCRFQPAYVVLLSVRLRPFFVDVCVLLRLPFRVRVVDVELLWLLLLLVLSVLLSLRRAPIESAGLLRVVVD